MLTLQAARPECTPQPAIPDSAKVKSWNPFTKDKDPPAAGANAAQQAHTHRVHHVQHTLSWHVGRLAFCTAQLCAATYVALTLLPSAVSTALHT